MDVDQYAQAATTPMPAFMDELFEETHATQTAPQMLTGPLAARLLDVLVWATRAERVLEIGTYTGYSALAMAASLAPGGTVTTLELDPERAAFARSHIDRTGYADRIEIRVGPALDTIRELTGPFDLVFIDADKTGYPDYFEAVLPLLADRGLIVLDNMLRGGDVLREGGDDGTRTLRSLSSRLAADPRVVSVLLPVRDGMTVVRRAGGESGPPPA